MATMVKEKRREKKKYKEKTCKAGPVTECPKIANQLDIREEETILIVAETSASSKNIPEYPTTKNFNAELTQTDQKVTQTNYVQEEESVPPVCTINLNTNISIQNIENQNVYLQCTEDLDKVNLSDVSIGSEANESIQHDSQVATEPSAPSAPIMEDEVHYVAPMKEMPVVNEVKKLESMPLEEAMKLYGGTVISEVIVMSEREETIVEAGPTSGPEHPLVDLLSTFRSSLIAVKREGAQLEIGYAEEEKFRLALWKIDKRILNKTEKCPCGLLVYFKATYEHAELQTDKLPIARLRLDKMLKDVQESYCHHQHEALLAHYQIEEFISETVKSHKGEIREALTLVLQALKMCDNTPPMLAAALERWARALSMALIDQRDLSQLLFLIHHLFRQTRSIRWAANIITLNVTDSVSATRAVAILDLLLARTKIDSAIECVEDKEDAWEEVDKDGIGGAVSEGSLRERDLLALLRILPMRDIVATILRLHQVGDSRGYQWQDSGGEGMVRACSGVRLLLHTLYRAIGAHARYTRLQRTLRGVAAAALTALAALHQHARGSYTAALEEKVLGELQAVFLSGLEIMGNDLCDVPASLLATHTARDYCVGHMLAVEKHGEWRSQRIESLSLDLPRVSCDVRVRVVAHAAMSRRDDYELARLVLEFLFQVGVRRNKTDECKGACRLAAQNCFLGVLSAHPYLHALALHLVAEINPVEKLDTASVECLSIGTWRPQCGEVRIVLDAWGQKCPHLLPSLLTMLDCTPHLGVSLESQLAIGSWLCEYVGARGGEVEEWCWRVMRRLRIHRVYWRQGWDAPPPSPHPTHLFAHAHALAASSWGHCVPMICSDGVESLYKLATTRAQDALHYLFPIMLVLAQSPESVSTTPRFRDLFTLLINAGPGLFQRALGRGGAPGADSLLRLMLEQLKHENCGGVSRADIESVWLAALWRVEGGAALLDAALLRPPPLDSLTRHATCLACAQDDDSQRQLLSATKWYSDAPLLCESALRACAQREVHARVLPRLLDALHAQRSAAQRIHVDNALKSLGVTFSSDRLTIYGVAAAAMSAPESHPASVTIWRLLLHLYLQRPPVSPVDATPPVGPLFFSGIIKSRTLAQLKRCILKFIQYHGNRASALKTKQSKTKLQPAVRAKSEPVAVDNSLTKPLSITDLIGVSNESSDSDTGSSQEQNDGSETDGIDEGSSEASDVCHLLAYHVGAERLFCEYLRWLDEGEKTKVMPHDAEIGRFIPDWAFQAAFQQESRYRSASLSPNTEPPPLPLSFSPPDAPSPAPPTPLQEAARALLSIRGASRKRSRKLPIRSLLEDVNTKDPRALIALVDEHLKRLQKLSIEWCKEVTTVASLDSALWDLVRGLRVTNDIPVLHASCLNKCKPLTYAPQERQSCISTGAQQGIVENRNRARSAIRRLARSRPDAARSATALLALARRSGSFETARRMVDRALGCARDVSENCAPAAAALTSFVEIITERWLASSGSECAALLTAWCGVGAAPAGVQRALCVALLAPPRARPAHVPALHAALLAAHLTAAQMFSALSKFELSKWSQSVDTNTRREMLNSLTAAAQRWGFAPTEEYLLLVELLGVQMSTVCHATELCVLASMCARACVSATLPPAVLRHIVRAAEKCAAEVPFDQLGHLLRELGIIWWEARTKATESDIERYDAYAPHTAGLLLTLHRAFVEAAFSLSYTPEKVAMLSWSSLQEAFAAWILPGAPPSLPPSLLQQSQYTNTLQAVYRSLNYLIHQYPGTGEVLLNQVFEWVIQTYQSVRSSSEGRLELCSLLASFGNLPWTEHQWLQPSGLQALLQVSQSGDEDVLCWCARCCGGLLAGAWLRGAWLGQGAGPGQWAEPGEALATRLAALLYLWTATTLPATQQTLERACNLWWERLPVPALEDALERFFQLNYGLSTPYHDLPQFKVILAASELSVASDAVSGGAVSREKRAHCVSRWTRAAAEPVLLAHVPAHVAALTRLLHDIAPHLARMNSDGDEELVELVGRALTLMCIEPAAAAALPVWERFVSSSAPCMVQAILGAVAGLTAFEYFAPLADAAVRTHLAQGGTWGTVCGRWRACVWADPSPLCARARLHAAYAAHAHAHCDAHHLRAAFLALVATDIDFKKNEAIVAVWICAASRAARSCGPGGEGAECRSAAGGLLRRWGGAPRGLMRLVLPSAAGPTTQHRLLCLLGQCILSPDNENVVRAYESTCATVLGSNSDVITWGRNPYPKRLPRLAIRLFPSEEKYFDHEMNLAPEDT